MGSKLGIAKKKKRRHGKEKYTLDKSFSTLGINPFSCCIIKRGSWWYNFERGLCISAGFYPVENACQGV